MNGTSSLALCNHWVNMAEAHRPGQLSRLSQRKAAACYRGEPLPHSCFFRRADHREHDHDSMRAPVAAYCFRPWQQESPLMDGVSQWSADTKAPRQGPKWTCYEVSYMTQAGGAACLVLQHVSLICSQSQCDSGVWTILEATRQPRIGVGKCSPR